MLRSLAVLNQVPVRKYLYLGILQVYSHYIETLRFRESTLKGYRDRVVANGLFGLMEEMGSNLATYYTEVHAHTENGHLLTLQNLVSSTGRVRKQVLWMTF